MPCNAWTLVILLSHLTVTILLHKLLTLTKKKLNWLKSYTLFIQLRVNSSTNRYMVVENRVKCLNMLYSDNDVVDWDVNQFDEKSDEAHDCETDGCGDSNLLEL